MSVPPARPQVFDFSARLSCRAIGGTPAEEVQGLVKRLKRRDVEARRKAATDAVKWFEEAKP
jgi:hypothetical protein